MKSHAQASASDPAASPLFRLRHSITDTDYEVQVLRQAPKELEAKDKKAGCWVRCDQALNSRSPA